MKIIFDDFEQMQRFKRKVCPSEAIEGGNSACHAVKMNCDLCWSTCDIEMEVKDE